MILIVSKDKDFSRLLCEHVSRELDVACEAANAGGVCEADLVIADHEVSDYPQVPRLVIDRPVRLAPLLAAIKARLNESRLLDAALPGGIIFSPRGKKLVYKNRQSDLTDKEVALMAALLRSGEAGQDKNALLKDIWGFEADLNTHTLETHIYRLRNKCKELSGRDTIEATEGGYRLK